MLIGPVFTREIVLTPRRPRTYILRSAYGLGLLVLAITAWLVLTGTQRIRDVGDLARFGTTVFQLLAPLQLAIAVFFSALLAASAVAQEKDRRTLDLLLLTKLSNSELVLGKLLASLLHILMPLAAAFPLFMLLALLGGVSFGQIGRVLAVTVASVLACGSLGSTLALWREKTFQSLAMTLLVLVLWLAFWRGVALGLVGSHLAGALGPDLGRRFQPVGGGPRRHPAVRPDRSGPRAAGTPFHLFLLVATAITVGLNALAIALVRVWNPSREAQAFHREDETWHREHLGRRVRRGERDGSEGDGRRGQAASETAAGPRPPAAHRTRQVWDNPIVWREIATWAYGRKMS